jgi:DNA primase
MALVRPTFPKSEVSEQSLDKFKSTRTKYFEQWFSPRILERFEVGGRYVDANGVQREIIPIRNTHGVLVALSGRSLDDSWPKYIFTDGFQRKHNLYNIQCLNDYNDIIVVEGFKAVWFLHSLGYDNSVACMGPEVSPAQIKLLLTYSVKNVTLILDGGDNQRSASIKNKIDTKIINLPDEDKSPDDYQQEFIINLLTEI